MSAGSKSETSFCEKSLASRNDARSCLRSQPRLSHEIHARETGDRPRNARALVVHRFERGRHRQGGSGLAVADGGVRTGGLFLRPRALRRALDTRPSIFWTAKRAMPVTMRMTISLSIMTLLLTVVTPVPSALSSSNALGMRKVRDDVVYRRSSLVKCPDESAAHKW